MARKPRLFVPEAKYHIYCRVARGEFVFDDPYEAEELVNKVREIRIRAGQTIPTIRWQGNYTSAWPVVP